MRNTSLAFSLIGGICIAAVAMGCRATSPYMKPLAGPPNLQAAADKALVVFARPSGSNGGIVFTVLDEQGKFVGDSAPKTVFVVPVEPGRHIFISWAENSAAIEVNAQAGKTYWVHVLPRMGTWTARVQLLAVKPGSDTWAEKDAWLREAQAVAPDLVAGQAHIDGRAEDTRNRLDRGLQSWDDYGTEERSDRTLKPEDGV